jgi:hypothetical protein
LVVAVRAGPGFADGAFVPPVLVAALRGADAATTVFAVDGRPGFRVVEAVFRVDGPAVAAAPGFAALVVLPTGPRTARSGAGPGARVPAPVPAFVLVRRAATAPDLVAAGGAAFARSAMASPICKTGAQRARCALRRLARIRNVKTDDNTAHRSPLVGALTSL